MRTTGVFIGKDAEMVRTGRYEIIFRRGLAGISYIESLWCDISEAMGRVGGICRMSRGGEVTSYAITERLSNDDDLLSRIGKPPEHLEVGDGAEVRLIFGNDDYDLALTESISVCKPYPRRSLRDSSIAECLCDWQKGTKVTLEDDVGFILMINTDRHMYIFQVWGDQVYIRAARYACADQGIVFAQNIRMRSGSFSEAWMDEDNRNAARELQVDLAKFSPDRCYMPPNVSDGIYWSLKNYDADREQIVLNGCQGQDYIYTNDDGGCEEFFR